MWGRRVPLGAKSGPLRRAPSRGSEPCIGGLRGNPAQGVCIGLRVREFVVSNGVCLWPHCRDRIEKNNSIESARRHRRRVLHRRLAQPQARSRSPPRTLQSRRKPSLLARALLASARCVTSLDIQLGRCFQRTLLCLRIARPGEPSEASRCCCASQSSSDDNSAWFQPLARLP